MLRRQQPSLPVVPYDDLSLGSPPRAAEVYVRSHMILRGIPCRGNGANQH